jgi:hypothetical protein
MSPLASDRSGTSPERDQRRHTPNGSWVRASETAARSRHLRGSIRVHSARRHLRSAPHTHTYPVGGLRMRMSWTKLTIAACLVPAAIGANGCLSGSTTPDNEPVTEVIPSGSEDGHLGEARSAATWCCRVPTPVHLDGKVDCYTFHTWGIWAVPKCIALAVVGAGSSSLHKGECKTGDNCA